MATQYNENYNYEMDVQVNTDEKKRPRRIYSTALINQLIKDRSMGYDIDYDPFYMRDLDLRAAGITFKMTEEEMEIYQKCYDDPLYYVENYCKFMTDKGLATVELRDFQKNVVDTVTQETYIPENDDFGPKNRNIIWMASRQSGKCFSPNMLIHSSLSSISDNLNKNSDLSRKHFDNIPFFHIFIKDKKLNLLQRLKVLLYIIYLKL